MQFVLKFFQLIFQKFDLDISRLIWLKLLLCLFDDVYDPKLSYTMGIVVTKYAKNWYAKVFDMGWMRESFF